jgi:hypothetical protein
LQFIKALALVVHDPALDADTLLQLHGFDDQNKKGIPIKFDGIPFSQPSNTQFERLSSLPKMQGMRHAAPLEKRDKPPYATANVS